MNPGQIVALGLMAVFYGAYFSKMALQKRKGIQTQQITRGQKSQRTRRTERFLSVATLAIVPAELVSILLDVHQLTSENLQVDGLLMAAAGVVIFVAAMVTMGNSWRAGVNEAEQTQLVTTGLYRFSRNPAFLGFDLMYIGILLAFFHVVLCCFTVLAIAALHLQILQEEAFLAKAFGPAYLEYKKKVGRYFICI